MMIDCDLSPTCPSEIKENSPQDIDYDLAIVGGGIVGATLACSLKDSGLKIVVIEPQPFTSHHSRPQAYAITLLSGMILKGLGVWDEILPQITTFHQINLCDGNDPKIVKFYPQDLGKTQKISRPDQAMGYVGEHRVLFTALRSALEGVKNIHWWSPAEVIHVNYKADYVEFQVKINSENPENYSLKTRLLIGADGSRSFIRNTANINTSGWKYWQSCIAMTIETEKPHHEIAYERFWPSGPMGVLPLPGNRCQVVWSAPHEEAQTLKELDETEFLTLLEYRTGGVFGQLKLLTERYVFPVQLMQSDRYVLPRLALIGDAAHCCHPVGGQGLNMGIRDAVALAQVLKNASENGKDIGAIDILKEYETWRRNENFIILGMTDFLDRLFSNTWIPIVMFRRFCLWTLRTISPLKLVVIRLMTGLLGKFPNLVE